jgi:hypothetical protein
MTNADDCEKLVSEANAAMVEYAAKCEAAELARSEAEIKMAKEVQLRRNAEKKTIKLEQRAVAAEERAVAAEERTAAAEERTAAAEEITNQSKAAAEAAVQAASKSDRVALCAVTDRTESKEKIETLQTELARLQKELASRTTTTANEVSSIHLCYMY